MSDQARLFIFPPQPEREGTSLGLLIDAYGNDYYKEQHRIVSGFGSGWLYYSFTNPETGRDEPKASYIKRVDWYGTPGGDRRGNLSSRHPGHLRERRGQRHGAGGTTPPRRGCGSSSAAPRSSWNRKAISPRSPLANDPRWKHGSIYLFGVDTYGGALFSGDPDSGQPGAGAPELNDMMDGPFSGRDVVSVGDAFGETLLHYTARKSRQRRDAEQGDVRQEGGGLRAAGADRSRLLLGLCSQASFIPPSSVLFSPHGKAKSVERPWLVVSG